MLLTNDIETQLWWILSGKKYYYFPSVFFVSLKDHMIEEQLINAFKYLDLTSSDFINYFNQNKITSWRVVNTNNYFFLGHLKYQANYLKKFLEAEKIILSARREAENLIAEIRVNQADKKTIKKVKDQFQNTLENLQIQDKTAEEEFNSLLESDIQKGSIIYIPHLNSKGKIIHLPDKKNRVRVEVNGITLTLKLAELQRAEASESSESNSKPNISMNKTFSIAKIQIDLRGMRVDEALHETEKHLDSALISGMSFVHILHGKGTGALMEAIHEFLSEQSFVANFHFADEDQGGAGITVVEFE